MHAGTEGPQAQLLQPLALIVSLPPPRPGPTLGSSVQPRAGACLWPGPGGLRVFTIFCDPQGTTQRKKITLHLN